MKKLIVTLSVLVPGITMGNLTSTINTNSNNLQTLFTNTVNNEFKSYQYKNIDKKIEVPKIENKNVLTDNSYRISDNVFITFITNKKNEINLYYVDINDKANIFIKKLGLVKDISIHNLFYCNTLHLDKNKIILFQKSYSKYIYLDVNNLEKPLVTIIEVPSQTSHRNIIYNINKINATKLIIATSDGTYYTNINNIHNPINTIINTKNNHIFSMIKVNARNYLINTLLSTPNGLVPELYILDVSQPLIPIPKMIKININFTLNSNLVLLAKVNKKGFVISIDNNIYYLNIQNLAKPLLLKLDIIVENDDLANIQVINKLNAILLISTDKLTKNKKLIYINLSDLKNIIKINVYFPDLKDIVEVSQLLYLSNNSFIIRILHSKNQIVTYFLNIANIANPIWTESGLGSDHTLWKALKLSPISTLLNDKNFNCWYYQI